MIRPASQSPRYGPSMNTSESNAFRLISLSHRDFSVRYVIRQILKHLIFFFYFYSLSYKKSQNWLTAKIVAISSIIYSYFVNKALNRTINTAITLRVVVQAYFQSNALLLSAKLTCRHFVYFENGIRSWRRESSYGDRIYRFDRRRAFNFESTSVFCLHANTDLILHPVCHACLRGVVRLEMSKWKLLLHCTFYEATSPDAITSLLESHTQNTKTHFRL